MNDTLETNPESRAARFSRLDKLARLLDSSIRLPGGYRIGLDGFIGMIPGAGDFLGSLLSSYIVFESARLGASKRTLARMMLNVIIEAIVGVLPLIGDVFDFVWKANDRNMRLLEAEQPSGTPAARAGVKRLGLVALAMLLVVVVLLATVVSAAFWIVLSLLIV